jgi:hypothetical protein
MNKLNFTQRQFIKRLVSISSDFYDIENFGVESITALITMGNDLMSFEKLTPSIKDFLSMIKTQKQWDKKLGKNAL